MTEVGWHHRLNGRESEQAPGGGEGQGGPECCSPWGCKESDMIERQQLAKEIVGSLDGWFSRQTSWLGLTLGVGGHPLSEPEVTAAYFPHAWVSGGTGGTG